MQNIVYGSPEAKQAGELEAQQHSKLVARRKYLHVFECEFMRSFKHIFTGIDLLSYSDHRVKPDAVNEYKAAA